MEPRKNSTKRQCNQLFDELVTILEYKKNTIDHAIYIKVFFDVTMYYLLVSTDDYLNTINNKT